MVPNEDAIPACFFGFMGYFCQQIWIAELTTLDKYAPKFIWILY